MVTGRGYPYGCSHPPTIYMDIYIDIHIDIRTDICMDIQEKDHRARISIWMSASIYMSNLTDMESVRISVSNHPYYGQFDQG